MPSYRFARRSFLAGIGGAFGLEILLRNMEAAAQGAGPPPRFLMMHWPVGTIRNQFIPSGSGTSYTTSKAGQGPGYIISPFDTPELRPHTIILHGFNMDGIRGEGGGHEDGTPFATTGAQLAGDARQRRRGRRRLRGRSVVGSDPARERARALAAERPGHDHRQGLLQHDLRQARRLVRDVDALPLVQLRASRSINSARPGGTIRENKPLLPEMSPLTAYKDLFGGFLPGATITDREALRLLKLRKSVLDYSLRELDRLKTLGPASEREKIDGHAAAVRKLEAQLSEQIAGRGTTRLRARRRCRRPPSPARTGSRCGAITSDPRVNTSDETTHEAVGKAHAAIIRAAFACDLIRVATFQWSPGTNHVSFKGRRSERRPTPSGCTTRCPTGSPTRRFSTARAPPKTPTSGTRWSTSTAGTSRRRRTSSTSSGCRSIRRTRRAGACWISTVIPMITEVAEASHTREGHAAIIFGGGKLGMQGGQYRSVSGIHNQLWVTVAQAFLGADAVSKLASEVYVKTGANPIPGLWAAPSA